MTGMRFAGRLAPNVKNVTPNAVNGDDVVTFTCGHVRVISPAMRCLLIEAGGHPVCLCCDGAAPAEPKPDKPPRYNFDAFYTDERGAQARQILRERQAAADLLTLAHGDRLGPDATANARTLQDRLRDAAKDAAGANIALINSQAQRDDLKKQLNDAKQRIASLVMSNRLTSEDHMTASPLAALTERVKTLEAKHEAAEFANRFTPAPRWWW